ncbi:hypothetical protein SBA4_3000014 [Candidatus Sulfopaludibacter sp. SbA4]|nr:hypothetical protein SBA4_3000014 [Candidatus Sulfopaludibacter sp. SbA4]
MHADAVCSGRHPDLQRRSEHRVGGAQLEAGGVLHGMDREVAGIEDQLIGNDAVEVERAGAFENPSVETEVEVEIEMADASLVGTREGVNVHASPMVESFRPSS